MTPHNELRLLPWSGPDGKTCFLSTDDTGGLLSRLADQAEGAQLNVGAELLEHTREVLTDEKSDPEELRLLVRDLADALRDALRVAVSRGHRLPTPDPALRGVEDGVPRLQAAAFG
ncbi:hypothetical protein ACFFSH_35255 [Streptomyces filamentosus]|uniref:Uncharacterized protein n=1 Tax=Streptomyces filamentosus TaxID=67294 RepID=A0A919EJZ2_STRFL|nr:hypothetical protein [Streptomyces filamentosus]GHF93151.1 hypothetical protein GCM10017667_23600 [Streptomyces filamentosus]